MRSVYAVLLTGFVLLLSGCAKTHYIHPDGYLSPGPYAQLRGQLPGWAPPPHVYRPTYTHKLLGDYAEQMTMKLVENLRYVNVSTPVAIASFVDLNSSLHKTNILGNQLAESFITELQEFGIPVVDFKATGNIEISADGDFAFSRAAAELPSRFGAQFVLSGTMTYSDRGVILNVRIVDLHNKVVVSSAKGFVPHFIVESLYPSQYRNGILLDTTE